MAQWIAPLDAQEVHPNINLIRLAFALMPGGEPAFHHLWYQEHNPNSTTVRTAITQTDTGNGPIE
jgi:hypothetical protein